MADETLAGTADRRQGAERRRRTLRSFLHGSFHPRRRAPRRAGDVSLTDVDLHHPQWLAVAVLILLCSCADAGLTLTLLSHGAVEVNPLMAALIYGNGQGFAATKIGLTAGGVVLLALLARVRAFGRLRVGLVLYAVLIVYVILIAYELWLLDLALSQP